MMLAFLPDWKPESWTAIATVGLAAGTVILAAAALRQARLTRIGLQASLEPILVDIPIGVFVTRNESRNIITTDDKGEVEIWADEGGVVRIQIPLRNGGSGLALIRGGATLNWPRAAKWSGATLHNAIPPAEFTRLDFRVEFKDDDEAVAAIAAIGPEGLAAEVTYTDIRGQQRARTRATVVRHPNPSDYIDFIVDRIDLYRGRRKRPFASMSGRSGLLVP